MRDSVRQIIGKTVTSIVVAESDSTPRNQLFLVFDDGTSFEFWGEHCQCASGLDGDGVKEILAYIKRSNGEVITVYSD